MRHAVAAAVLALGALFSLASAAPAAAQVNADALYERAYRDYEAGDFAEARTGALAAADAGSLRSKLLAAHLLERGLGGPADDAAARALYEDAAASDDIEALMALGLMAREGRGGLAPGDAAGYFQKAVDLKSPEALVDLAMLYADGVGVEPDPERARAMLREAALAGSRPAQRALGILLLTEGGDAEETTQAETWLATAAEAGDTQAAYVLGVSYATGDVLPADDARAARFLRLAANAGDAAAQADYGLLVYQGRGVEQSSEEAADWFRKAAFGGDQEGRTLYAIALAKGEGVERNLEEAYYWALRAAALGPSPALNYEMDRYRLITALEQALPQETKDRVKARVDASPDP